MCMVDYGDEDGMWLDQLHERRANKPHGCQDCGRTIAKGERYTYGVWKGDDLQTVKVCAHCKAAGRWLQVVCHGHLWPGVMEDLGEHWSDSVDYRSHGLGRLIKVGGARWQRNGELVALDDVRRWVDMALSRVPAEAHA